MIFRVRRAGGACCDANTRQAFITKAHGIIGIEGHHGGYAGNEPQQFVSCKKMAKSMLYQKASGIHNRLSPATYLHGPSRQQCNACSSTDVSQAYLTPAVETFMSENNERRGRLDEGEIRFNHESDFTCDCRCAQLILIQFVFLSMAKSSILLAVLQKFDGTFSCDSAPTFTKIVYKKKK